MSRKKTISTNLIEKWQRLEKLAFGIPFIILLIDVVRQWKYIKDILQEDHSVKVVIGLFCIYGIMALLKSVVFIIIWKIICYNVKKNAIKNATFEVSQDFDYYREKLEGLSPVLISLLMDLKIEQKKDIAASLLQYEMMGVISLEGGELKILNFDHPDLKLSDKNLLTGLQTKTFNLESDITWQNLKRKEALETVYLTDKFGTGRISDKFRGCGTCLIGVLGPVLLLTVAIILFLVLKNQEETIVAYTANFPEDASFQEVLDIFIEYPDLVAVIGGFFVALLFIILAFIFPVLWVIGVAVSLSQKSRIRRTKEGEIMTEYVAGMKNFLHDFSNLAEAQKEQLILWDDFLVYAVVLEENERVVQEIFRMKNMDYQKYKMYGGRF